MTPKTRLAGLFPGALVLSAALVVSSPQAEALDINFQFGSDVTSLPNAAQYEAATEYAGDQIDALFTNPVTLTINVDSSGVGPAGLGTSNTLLFGANGLAPINPSVPYVNFTYQQVFQALNSHVTSPADAIALAHLPASDPTNGVGFVMWRIRFHRCRRARNYRDHGAHRQWYLSGILPVPVRVPTI